MAYTVIQIAGPIYFLLVIPKTAIPWVMGIRRRKLEDALSAPKFPRPRTPEKPPQDA